MSQTIRISENVFNSLKRLAKEFETPNTVIEMALNHYEIYLIDESITPLVNKKVSELLESKKQSVEITILHSYNIDIINILLNGLMKENPNITISHQYENNASEIKISLK